MPAFLVLGTIFLTAVGAQGEQTASCDPDLSLEIQSIRGGEIEPSPMVFEIQIVNQGERSGCTGSDGAQLVMQLDAPGQNINGSQFPFANEYTNITFSWGSSAGLHAIEFHTVPVDSTLPVLARSPIVNVSVEQGVQGLSSPEPETEYEQVVIIEAFFSNVSYYDFSMFNDHGNLVGEKIVRCPYLEGCAFWHGIASRNYPSGEYVLSIAGVDNESIVARDEMNIFILTPLDSSYIPDSLALVLALVISIPVAMLIVHFVNRFNSRTKEARSSLYVTPAQGSDDPVRIFEI